MLTKTMTRWNPDFFSAAPLFEKVGLACLCQHACHLWAKRWVCLRCASWHVPSCVVQEGFFAFSPHYSRISVATRCFVV